MAWIGVAAAIAGAAMQQHSQAQMAARQKQLAAESQMRALNAQNQATQVATNRAQEFDPTVRKQAQDELQQTLTQGYEKAAAPQITAQGVQVGSTIPAAEGSTEYSVAKARETAKTQESMRQLAALMGRVGSANQLRRNEATGIGDAAGAIGRIQTGANNIAGIDQVGINSVTPNAALSIGGSALQAYGMGKLSTAGVGSAKHITQTPSAWLNG